MKTEDTILLIPYKTLEGQLHTLCLLRCDHTEANETYKCVEFESDVDLDMYAESVKKLQGIGYRVEDPDRWNYMGARTFGEHLVYCYAVDLTGVDQISVASDETDGPNDIEYNLEDVAITDALNNGDGYCCASLVQLFRYVFNVKDYDKLLKKREESDGQGHGALEEPNDGELGSADSEVA
jgi:hypothetical protein